MIFGFIVEYSSDFTHDEGGNFASIKIILNDVTNKASFTIIGQDTRWTAFGLGTTAMNNADAYVVNNPGQIFLFSFFLFFAQNTTDNLEKSKISDLGEKK